MNSKATSHSQSKEKYLKIISDFAIALMHQTTLDEVVWEMSHYVSRALGFYDCVVYLYDSQTRELVQKSAFGPKNPDPFNIKDPIVLPLGAGIVGHVAKTLEAEIVNDTSKDPRYIIDDEVRQSEITVPIVYESKLIGVIDSEHPDKNHYTQDELEILKTMASMCSTKIMQAKVFDYLQMQNEKLKISNDRLLQFVYVASHDLRSPVSNIVTLLSFLDFNKIEGENLTILNNVNNASKKLQGNLLRLIELVTDEDSLYKNNENVSFAKILDEVQFSIEKQILLSEAVIETDLLVADIEFPSVYLHSILLNLITNAIKYKSPYRAPEIMIRTVPAGNYVCLIVEDNGKGIDLEKNRLKIFNRLERFDRDISGKGLGLYLVKGLVEALGGKIEVESELQKGTTFKIYLSTTWKKTEKG